MQQYDAFAFQKIQPFEFYKKFMNENIRPDGRNFESSRKININLGSIESSDGSCLCKIGQTTFLCGIRAELGESTDLNPTGEIILKIHLPELSSPKFAFRKDIEAPQAVLKELISSIIYKKDFLDLKQLDIKVKDKLIAVWVLYLDVYCLENDGSLIDACLISVLGALKNCK